MTNDPFEVFEKDSVRVIAVYTHTPRCFEHYYFGASNATPCAYGCGYLPVIETDAGKDAMGNTVWKPVELPEYSREDRALRTLASHLMEQHPTYQERQREPSLKDMVQS